MTETGKKYYFSYYEWAGDAKPQMWVEDDGIPVGGRYNTIVKGTLHEITKEEFNGTLLEMEKKYPLEIDLTNYDNQR